MAPSPITVFTSPGGLVETPAGPALRDGPKVFGNVLEGAGGQSEWAQAQPVSRQLSGASAAALSSGPDPAASANFLRPKFEYAGNSLSVLRARVATIHPATAAESLRNRLQLLDSQFRLIGNDLKETAGRTDPMQLLRLQNDIYQIDEELELISRVVDQATSGIRSLLQTQI